MGANPAHPKQRVGGGGGGDTRRHCFKGARMPQKGTDVRKVMGKHLKKGTEQNPPPQIKTTPKPPQKPPKSSNPAGRGSSAALRRHTRKDDVCLNSPCGQRAEFGGGAKRDPKMGWGIWGPETPMLVQSSSAGARNRLRGRLVGIKGGGGGGTPTSEHIWPMEPPGLGQKWDLGLGDPSVGSRGSQSCMGCGLWGKPISAEIMGTGEPQYQLG